MNYAQQLQNRYRVMIGYVGTMFVGIAVLLLIPLLIAFGYKEFQVVDDLIYSALISGAIGLLLRHKFRIDTDISLTIQEGGVIVLFAWIGGVFFSALPFIFSGQLNFTQAIFESTSGWTTTGLSVVDVTETTKTFFFWRSFTQFLGGAGLTVLMLSAIIGPLGLGLFNAEGRSDKLLPNVTRSAKAIMFIYTGYTLGGIILYAIAGMPLFEAVIHSLSATSTGGFSTRLDSIGAYNNLWIELITIILMLLGSTSFAAHFLLFHRQGGRFFKIDENRLMWWLLAICIPFLAFFSLVKLYGSVGTGLRFGIFQIVSSLSGTGYSTVNLAEWDGFPRLMLILLMIIGGMAGSTSGGIKIYRIVLLLKSLVWNIRGYFLPKNIIRENIVMRADGPIYLKKSMIIETTNFLTLYIFFYIVGLFVFLLHGYGLSDSMFEMASALSTVGLSVGITVPTAPAGILWTQTIMMMMGRLEFFVVFFASIKVIKDLNYLARHKLA